MLQIDFGKCFEKIQQAGKRFYRLHDNENKNIFDQANID